METIHKNNRLSEHASDFFNRLRNYLDTKLYFYGSIQRDDYFNNDSDLDVAIFTDNVSSMLSKINNFFNVKKNEFKKFVWKLNITKNMVNGHKHMHIKSCTYGTKYPNSWLFQPTDKITTSPSELDMLALVIVEPPKNFSCYFVKALDVLDMYENPMKEELVKLGKKMLYESTISK